MTKKIFLQDKTVKKCTWSSQVLNILKEIYGQETQLDNFTGEIDLTEAKSLLSAKYEEDWNTEVKKIPKLRTYATLKTGFGKEDNVDNFLSKNRRSLIAQMRTGTSFVRIETGQYEREKRA